MPRFTAWILFLVILLSSSCCTRSNLKKEFTKGYIEYSISYDQTTPLKIDADLLPKVMLIKFYDNSILNKVEAFSGSVSLTYIINKELQKNITLVKLMNKKLYYEETIIEGKFPLSYNEMPGIEITKTDKTLNINGFHCNHAIGTLQDSTHYTFDIYYTKEIIIDNPNANTPFEAIDGIMLKFDVKLFNRLMSLSATKIKRTDISFEEFMIPPDYEQVTEETIQDVISLLQ